jgi:hypothetical protein
MTEIAYDYPEIRKRMLGDLKPKPKPAEHPSCLNRNDAGWIIHRPFGAVVTTECKVCKNPKRLPGR